ncbi:hypothetical protein ACVJF2_008286 [Bradyrhizobium sp. USDA 4519]
MGMAGLFCVSRAYPYQPGYDPISAGTTSGCMTDIVISTPQRRSLFPAAMILLVAGSLLALAYFVGSLIAHSGGG